ncbi:MAG TPA: LytTR family DNA-binding domain-containing protein [Ottowia sp.]|nr:LytTR family DNA-binding domain-containing protein [Ottowia sp.]
MTTPTALIAEDEPLLAAALQAELARAWPALRVLATVGDGVSAVAQALALRPDVLFFDIRMPGQSGLDAAAELMDAWDDTAAPFPALVFVTAYDQYAVQAFEAQAIDYLLKPVQPARLQKSVQKLRLALAQRAPAAIVSEVTENPETAPLAERLRQLLAALEPAAPAPLRQLVVSAPGSSGQRVRMVPIRQVLFLQAADKYVRVVTAEGEHLLRTPLKELLPQLDAAEFWQIHRATVVRADAIDHVQRDEHGRLHLHLRGCPERLAVSRLYAQRFRAL